jgi:hypothetical protein
VTEDCPDCLLAQMASNSSRKRTQGDMFYAFWNRDRTLDSLPPMYLSSSSGPDTFSILMDNWEARDSARRVLPHPDGP